MITTGPRPVRLLGQNEVPLRAKVVPLQAKVVIIMAKDVSSTVTGQGSDNHMGQGQYPYWPR